MNKTTVIAVALCLLLFVVWYPLMYRLGFLQQEQSQPAENVEEEATDQPVLRDMPDASEDEGSGVVKKEGGEQDESQGSADVPSAGSQEDSSQEAGTADLEDDSQLIRSSQPDEEDLAYLKQPDFMTMALDEYSGGIVDVSLENYQQYGDNKKVVLGNYRFPYCTTFLPDNSSELSESGEVLPETGDQFALQREARDGSFRLIERWQLEDDGYRFNYRVEIENRTDENLAFSGLRVGLGGMKKHVANDARLSRIGRVDLAAELAAKDGERPESYTVDDVEDIKPDIASRLASRELDWIAIHNKYFLFYLSEDSLSFQGCHLDTFSQRVEQQENGQVWLYGQAILPDFSLPAGEKEVFNFNGYAGPKEYNRLRAIDGGLESIMRLDLFMFFRTNWMSWISKTILQSLIFFRNIFPFPGGYGIAIIIVTIIIKLLFWPLTHKSTVSMRRMQKLQPLIKEIREKYKDDAQKMNRKVMELYREHKVNPLGGCLPILFQIPVFFALFNTLRGAIELRQASFLWVADLSMPDTLPWMPLGLPLRPLAILMALTMFLQQKLSPSSGDPTQKRMMYFMTMFFMFIFYTMPAGLTLYWTTNQILTIVQNLFISKKESSEEKGK